MNIYMMLKKIHDSKGSSKDIHLAAVHQLLQAGLITEHTPTPNEYRLQLTAKGHACINDRPIEPEQDK